MRHYASAAYNDPDPDYWPDPGPVMDLFAIKVLNESIDPSLWIYSSNTRHHLLCCRQAAAAATSHHQSLLQPRENVISDLPDSDEKYLQ